jgi:2'-5' RNA ligase
VDRVVVAIGYAPVPRPFRAHVTVARLARKAAVRAVLDRMDPVAGGPAWGVDELVLFESDTRASGAVHRVVGRFALAG